MTENAGSEKPSVLIVGGLGTYLLLIESLRTTPLARRYITSFVQAKAKALDTGYIGRFLALHIHNNNLASQVRIVDKQLPELAYLSPEFKEACPRDIFVQADASRERMSNITFAPKPFP